MEQNPFTTIEERIDKVERLLLKVLEVSQGQQKEADEIGDIRLAESITLLKPATIYSHVFHKKIPFFKRGGKLYFSRNKLEEWLLNGTPQNEPASKPLFPYRKKPSYEKTRRK